MSEKMIRKTAVMEVIKAHMDGEDKNTKAVLSDVMESVNELETLSQEPQCTEHPCLGTLCRYYKEPCDECRNKRTSFCGNCKEYDEYEPCDDAISREAVCDYIAEFVNHEYSTDSECEMVDLMVEGIQHLPSVTHKSGKCKTCKYWQDNNNGYPLDMCKWRTDETPDADDYCSEYEPQENEEQICQI